jgi:hypothetical protein
MIVGMHLAYPQSPLNEEDMTTKLKNLTPNLLVENDKQVVLREFRQIPGVGKSIAVDLWNLGLRSVSDLKNQDPEALYMRLCAFQGLHVDRCMLYVFRCAVYYASNDVHDAELLKWWNWKEVGFKYNNFLPR